MTTDCVICRAQDGDAELSRVEVWSDDLWRLTTSVGEGEVIAGFSYLEPRRHISDISALDGDEAATFGPTLARVTSALKAETGSELVYIYVFGGGIPHLHLHLLPHTEGDAAATAMIRGELKEEKLPSGATQIISVDFPSLSPEEIDDLVERLRTRLRSPE